MASTFFGHPRGLATLFFTEMWERFTYYGMRAVLVLFLVAAVSSGGFGMDDKTATAIYGLYTAGVYLAALPGGWIADRLIGARRAVLIGGIGIALGNALLAASTSPREFYLGLVVIVLGVGLLKPNVSAMVADLYPEGGARLDAGFTVFYMGINLGATIGPFVTGEAQQYFGLRAGFAVGCRLHGARPAAVPAHAAPSRGRRHIRRARRGRSVGSAHAGCVCGSRSDCPRSRWQPALSVGCP